MNPNKSPNNVDLKDKTHALSASDGRLKDDRLEIDDISSNLSKNSGGDDALAQASLSKPNKLKGAMQTLNKLSASIATTTTTATPHQLAEATIPHHGLSSFPLEILSLVRVWLHVLENPAAYASLSIESYLLHQVTPNRSFPLVCRRFREVELSTPELWTTVASNMTFERIKLHIARSGDLPLRVRIISDPYRMIMGDGRDFCQCDLWELIASHVERCEWMDICVEGYPSSGVAWRSDVRNCFDTFDGAHFRKLRRLAIVSEHEVVLSTIRTWSMPQLSELFSTTPAVLFALPISHPLDVLRLSVDHERFDTNDLIDLLSSPAGSNVKTFDLAINMADFPGTPSTSRAVLPALESFRLRLNVAANENIHSLFQRIQAPSIVRIAVEIIPVGFDIIDYLTEWISSQRHPNLRNVDVQLCGYTWDEEDEDDVRSKIVDAISLHDFEAIISNPPVVSVKAPDLDW